MERENKVFHPIAATVEAIYILETLLRKIDYPTQHTPQLPAFITIVNAQNHLTKDLERFSFAYAITRTIEVMAYKIKIKKG